MALPSSGPISFYDFNTEYELVGNATINMRNAALMYEVPFATDGSNPISMDEFYGLSIPLYDIYESCNAPSILTYYVRYFNSNTYTSTIGGAYCYVKIATQVTPAFIAANYPGIEFTMAISHDECSCSGGGGGGPIE